MQRDFLLNRLMQNPDKQWDIVVIGGGATSLGIAVDAASRGYETMLLEQSDFNNCDGNTDLAEFKHGKRFKTQLG